MKSRKTMNTLFYDGRRGGTMVSFIKLRISGAITQCEPRVHLGSWVLNLMETP